MNRSAVVGVIAVVLLVGQAPAWAQDDRESARLERANRSLTRWLDEDVAYIIVDEERAAFKAFSTDEERQSFIEQFWLRRDPTPDSIENEYREEHYRRIAYANERFASGLPGWKTDRGRIYIIHGEPAGKEGNPAGGAHYRSFEEGGGRTVVYPFEKWRYRYIEGMGTNVEFEFVDPTLTGEFRLALSPNEKDALTRVPGVGYTYWESQSNDAELVGQSKFDRGAGLIPGGNQRINQFDLIQQYANAFRPPKIKFADLEEIVTTRLSYNLLPFDLRTDFVRVTGETVLTPITVLLKRRDLAYQDYDGIHEAVVHVFGQVTGVNGRIAQTFEDTVTVAVPEALFEDSLDRFSIYQKVLPLSPGLYKIDLVLKDINSSNVGTVNQALQVPRFSDEQLTTSSLILADLIEPLPPRQVGSAPFVLGNLKVRPSVNQEFFQNQELKYWIQVYNLQIDENTLKPSATVETLITRDGEQVRKIVEDTAELSGAAQQMTLQKTLALTDFEPGEYSLQVRITDNLAGEITSQSSKFVVLEPLVASNDGQ